jgi:hypothetical protein
MPERKSAFNYPPISPFLMSLLKQSVAFDVSKDQPDTGPADQIVHLRSAFP